MHLRLPLRTPKRIYLQCRYTSTTTSNAPPILTKIRKDMITALKARDTQRLDVLRALLADTTNAAKTSQPIKTDVQFLTLLKKRMAASRSAAVEFGAANREDLKAKEEGQVRVLEEYAGCVDTVGEEEMRRVVGGVVERLRKEGRKIALGEVLREVLDEGGELGGRPVERGVLVGIVRGVLDEGGMGHGEG